ncbi:MAG: hypothetical protein JO128_10740 [Alphaproteobacteria bacterium]|nr:hypothetical protein [Alphaproteobacteria bacterium]
MSRLDSFIRRLQAQRACLDWAIEAIGTLPGPVLEIGLGNGRTYDHLRSRLGQARAIFAFDRQLAAHPACAPDRDHLVLGDFRDTLPGFARRLRAAAALVHADTGSGDEAASQAQAQWLAGVVDDVLAPEGVVVSDQDMSHRDRLPPGWHTAPLPPEVQPGRYFIYRKAPGPRASGR